MRFITLKWRTLVLSAVLVVGAVCVSNVAAQGTAGSGTFTDTRDGKTYKTVKIGGKTWMAENLNYQPQSGKSWCYDNNVENCKKYGRLYDWNTAKTVCPVGWKLPDTTDWNRLAKTVGGERDKECDEDGGCNVVWNNAGKKLKSKIGWTNRYDESSGNGTDEYGFSALPGGRYWSYEGNFGNDGSYGYWWTATKYYDSAFRRDIRYNDDLVGENIDNKSDGNSVRCVRE
jgi:uncharacterized protein (TIGR02145 family)